MAASRVAVANGRHGSHAEQRAWPGRRPASGLRADREGRCGRDRRDGAVTLDASATRLLRTAAP
ncbi:MAG TPA: hypothetical protein VF940_16740, partial [Streptosporangiaceae bacterium]